DHDAGQARLQVGQVFGEAEHGHDLRGGRDVEAGLARHAFGGAAQPDDDVAQRAVVDVQAAAPGDAAGVDAQGVALLQRGIDDSSQQVVGGGDGMEVAREVQVDVLH